MRQLNAAIASIPLPERMRHLPVSDTGYPVPWFALTPVKGRYDLRFADPARAARAFRLDLCWLCGQTLGRFKTWCLGPMCAVNRTTVEPPQHRECAEYAAKACPFLTRPRMRRNDAEMPEGHQNPGGIMIRRNPGVVLIWVTKEEKAYRLIDDGDGGVIVKIGEPCELTAWAEGRLATRDELDESIRTGLPLL